MNHVGVMKISIFLLLFLSSSWAAPLLDVKNVDEQLERQDVNEELELQDVNEQLELFHDGVHGHTDPSRSGKHVNYNNIDLGDSNGNIILIGDGASITIGESLSQSNTPLDVEEPIAGQWSPYGPCNKICGGGLKERICSNPAVDQGRRSCRGSSVSACNAHPCIDVSVQDAIKVLKETMQVIGDGLFNLEKISPVKRSVESFSLYESKLLAVLSETTKYIEVECSIENGHCQLEDMQSFLEGLASTFNKIQASGKVTPGFLKHFQLTKNRFDREAAIADAVQADSADDSISEDDPEQLGLPGTCSFSGFIPHPTDCRKYYRCSSGHAPEQYTCAAGTKWSTLINSCSDKEEHFGQPTSIDCAPGIECLDDCLCKNNDGKGELCSAGKICLDGVCLAKICKTRAIDWEDCFCRGGISGGTHCKAGEKCNQDGSCQGQTVCPVNAINSKTCFCEFGTSRKGETCAFGQGCTKDGRCLEVCKPDETNSLPCFCEDGSTGTGVACDPYQKCSKDGNCHFEVPQKCLPFCATAPGHIEEDCFCENNNGQGEICSAEQLCQDGRCINQEFPQTKGFPSKVLGLYLTLSDDDINGRGTYDVQEDIKLHEYQQSGANVLFFSFIHPKFMDVPESFKTLAATRGTNVEGAVPADTKIIFAIGGIGFSKSVNPWPWLTTKSQAEEMAIKVAQWKDDYGCDGIDLDIEQGAGEQSVAGENMIHFVKKVKELQPDMIITQPVYGYPGQVPANDEMVNAAWTASGSSNGLLDSVGIMLYKDSDSLDWVKKYTEGKSPITAKVPRGNILVGIQGGASSGNIVALAEACITQKLLGIMVWVSSVKNGIHYGDNSSGEKDSEDGFKKAMEMFRHNIDSGSEVSASISDSGTEVSTPIPVDKDFVIPDGVPSLAQAEAIEEFLTSSELMKKVKHSIKTLDSNIVDQIAPGRSQNPENVKRVERFFKESDFEDVFPQRNALYTYRKFLQAIGKFPGICDTYKDRDSDLICKKTLATLFAHFTQETGGHNPSSDVEEWRQGLYYLEELCAPNCGYNSECAIDNWVTEAWPCGKNPDGSWKKYFGRGAKQLSYNYNYGPFSDAMFGTVRTLLDDPFLVSTTWLSLAAATWFFAYPQPPKPSMLFVLDGSWQPNQEDTKNKLEAGFGATIMILNGGIECGHGAETPQAINRINYYKKFSEYFKVDIEGEQLSCAHMSPFSKGGAGSLPIYWEEHWTKKYQCKLVNYQTQYTAFKKGDYARCVQKKFDVILS